MVLEKIKNDYLKNVIDFIFPPLCLGCGEYTEEQYDICPQCINKFNLIKQPYCLNCFSFQENNPNCPICKQESLLLYSFASYLPPLKDIIIQFKFKGITKTADLFSKELIRQFHDLLISYQADCLVPVPLYPSRENIRGYNQAAVFADCLSTKLDLPVREDLLHRTIKRKPQARLSLKDRAQNIKSVFELDDTLQPGTKCIIVDDVVTSGNTVLEAARMLRQCGCHVSAVISIAHAL